MKYEDDNNILTAGLNLRGSEKLDFALAFSWMNSKATMLPFSVTITPEFAALVPKDTYDYQDTDGYSDIDVSRVYADLTARYRLNARTGLRGWYRYVNYSDEAPILYDTTGKNHVFGAAISWTF
jgi:hypothetical protein